MARSHHYELDVTWTGNTGSGTSGYRDFERAHEVSAAGKPVLLGSSDPSFRGDPGRWNPEDLLVASLSQCHMLWYLALCAQAGVVVTDYRDHATGTMDERSDGGGAFSLVTLHPQVRISDETQTEKAMAIHERAHHLCFIANSVNFDVRCEPTVLGPEDTAGG
ncbi:OsmC family protein [Mycobacterium sp. ACS4331]|uniref:OsmC family protein n=1 Tax=Mycobacterium sp. ACS4331 TaxID=1834121 RepID=UPI0007FDA536|nr:OsmC family protein [Mycobacterium sp. ACS4331]OBF26447.1 peroxiredoxin [Mycobacterium sp. ACS4331]